MGAVLAAVLVAAREVLGATVGSLGALGAVLVAVSCCHGGIYLWVLFREVLGTTVRSFGRCFGWALGCCFGCCKAGAFLDAVWVFSGRCLVPRLDLLVVVLVAVREVIGALWVLFGRALF